MTHLGWSLKVSEEVMRILNMSEALNEALREEMQHDPKVLVIGEDVGGFGGAFSVTRGLVNEFGEERVRDTPLSEAAIIGCGIGAAMLGWRPVVEMQYSDFVACAYDQVVNQAAKIHLMSGGQTKVPMVIRLPTGAKEHGAQHDQSVEAWFMHIPGLKVVIPSTPYDAKGLLKTAIRDDNPVIFCEHKVLYGTQSVGGRGLKNTGDRPPALGSQIPDHEYTLPFGVADIKRSGSDITIVATALMVHRALEAAERLTSYGIEAEVIDPRTLVPLDMETILHSVSRTHRIMVVSEETRTGSAAAEIAARVAEEGFDELDAPVLRLTTPDLPLPFTPHLQENLIPSTAHIAQMAKDLIEKEI
jgi:pyruvate/2-oxoglutarate/acetoin dehydrogenase E1 component